MKRGPDVGEAFTNLYRDLRDRRLLPVILLLVVAIVAVPFLLGKDAKRGGGAGAGDAVPIADAGPFDGVVVQAEPELRAFRERLADFQSRNPFHQEVPVEDEAAAAGSEAGSALPTDNATTTDTGTVPDSGTLPVAPPPGSPTTPPDTSTGTDTGDSSSTDTGETPTDTGEPAEPETTLVTTRVDVKFGKVGKQKVYEDVKPLEFLPERQGAVLEFLQGDFDLTKAIFIVSPEVTLNDGDGKCAPSPGQCAFLQLEVGQEHAFQFDGEFYRLKLLEVRLHEEPFEEGSEEESDSGREGDSGTPGARVVVE